MVNQKLAILEEVPHMIWKTEVPLENWLGAWELRERMSRSRLSIVGKWI